MLLGSMVYNASEENAATSFYVRMNRGESTEVRVDAGNEIADLPLQGFSFIGGKI